MLNFSKINVLIIYLIFFFVAIFAVFNFQKQDIPYINKKINLGLDLQGGSYLLLEINSDTLIQEKIQDKVIPIKKLLKENNIEYSNVIYLDDDIQNIMDFDKPLECLKTLGNDIFKELAKQNLYVAGVSPYHNTFYLKKNISRSLKYVCGCFRAEIIRRDEPLILCEMGHFEDHQFSCEYFLRDGGLLRYNWIALVTKYFELEGGICGQLGGMDARQEQMEENAMVMLSLYPDMCRAVEKQYGFDIRLNHNYKIK